MRAFSLAFLSRRVVRLAEVASGRPGAAAALPLAGPEPNAGPDRGAAGTRLAV